VRAGGREALIAYLSGAAVAPKPAVRRSPDESEPETGASESHVFDLTIRLDRDDLRRLDEESLASGYTKNKWVLALIRARLSRKPQFNRSERIGLASIAKTLREIERALSKTARMFADPGAPTRALLCRLDEMQRFHRQVGEIARALDAAFKGADAYWRTSIGDDDERIGRRPVVVADETCRSGRRPVEET
jgi:hypothetical protein